jgi:cholera toxin transcriptional activator
MTDLPPSPRRAIRFGVFELDLQAAELRKAGARLSLPAQSFEVLSLLLERPGDLVTREELRQRLWPNGTFVDFDHGLNAVVTHDCLRSL